MKVRAPQFASDGKRVYRFGGLDYDRTRKADRKTTQQERPLTKMQQFYRAVTDPTRKPLTKRAPRPSVDYAVVEKMVQQAVDAALRPIADVQTGLAKSVAALQADKRYPPLSGVILVRPTTQVKETSWKH